MRYTIEKVSNQIVETDSLPTNIKNKIAKYRREERRKQSIIGYYSIIRMLKEDNISNVNFFFNDYGKPYLIDNNSYFNISHSYDYVISVISNKEIGVDIEKIRSININTIDQFATYREKEYILSSKKDVEKRYFQIYTLKESYFKMLGTNLNDILNIEFTINDNKVICSNKNCNAYIIDILDDYVISYCEKK